METCMAPSLVPMARARHTGRPRVAHSAPTPTPSPCCQPGAGSSRAGRSRSPTLRVTSDNEEPICAVGKGNGAWIEGHNGAGLTARGTTQGVGANGATGVYGYGSQLGVDATGGQIAVRAYGRIAACRRTRRMAPVDRQQHQEPRRAGTSANQSGGDFMAARRPSGCGLPGRRVRLRPARISGASCTSIARVRCSCARPDGAPGTWKKVVPQSAPRPRAWGTAGRGAGRRMTPVAMALIWPAPGRP
jgi:hypothetical protein